MMENERSTAINPHEAVEEKVSLSDRFGLWLGFHKCSQDEYLAMVSGYVDHYGLVIDADRADRGCPGVVDDPRRALGPGRLAVHSGSGGTTWGCPLGRAAPPALIDQRPIWRSDGDQITWSRRDQLAR